MNLEGAWSPVFDTLLTCLNVDRAAPNSVATALYGKAPVIVGQGYNKSTLLSGMVTQLSWLMIRYQTYRTASRVSFDDRPHEGGSLHSKRESAESKRVERVNGGVSLLACLRACLPGCLPVCLPAVSTAATPTVSLVAMLAEQRRSSFRFFLAVSRDTSGA